MSLSERDKKLLLVLFMIIIGFLFYNFFYLPFSEKIDLVSKENTNLKNRYDEIIQRLAIYNANKDKIKTIENDYNRLSSYLPPNQDEKFTVLDIKRLAKQYNNTLQNITLSQKQFLDLPELPGINQVYYFSMQQNWTISYYDFKKLLASQKDFTPLYAIDSININNVQNKVMANFNLKFFGFIDELAPTRKWYDFDIKTGKGDLFSSKNIPKLNATDNNTSKNNAISQGNNQLPTNNNLQSNGKQQLDNNGNSAIVILPDKNSNTNKNNSNNNIPSQSQDNKNNINIKNADFTISVSTIESPTTNVVIEKTGSVSIFGANKLSENIHLYIKGNKGNYLYQYKTGKSQYPKNNFEKFNPIGRDIIIAIYSTSRRYEKDNNIVIVNIHNQSDKTVKVYIKDDDIKKPRVRTQLDGSGIYVEKI
ncbi:hypothetical protein ACAG39_03100 [Caldicellulosiruptoraceae bacterium PP1]